MSDLRAELVQVAAVAVAWIENLDYGHTAEGPVVTNDVLDDVAMERVCQESKWGARDMPGEKWLPILIEEVGEVAEALLGLIDWSGVEVTDDE